eukprot:56359_1
MANAELLVFGFIRVFEEQYDHLFSHHVPNDIRHLICEYYNLTPHYIHLIETWLAVTGDRKQDRRMFTKRMIELLSNLTKSHQLRIVEAWQQTHRDSIFEVIEKKLNGKTKGPAYRVLSGLLQSYAEVDKLYIQQCIDQEMQIGKIADVIISRTVDELRELEMFLKKQNENDTLLSILENEYDKNIMMIHLFENLCNTEQRERNKQFQTQDKVNMIEIANHIEWINMIEIHHPFNFVDWNHSEKEKFCRLFTLNSNAYVQILCKQYKSKSNNEHISYYIDTKFGAKSMFARYIKDHIAFVEDPNLYFAKKVLVLAASKQACTEIFSDNHLQILHIFLSQFPSKLKQIQKKFHQIHGDTLRHYIFDSRMVPKHNYLYFLLKLLDNSK